jgi:hypothetical protein
VWPLHVPAVHKLRIFGALFEVCAIFYKTPSNARLLLRAMRRCQTCQSLSPISAEKSDRQICAV